MDNQATESSNTPLDVNQAASAFAEMLEPRKEEQEGEAVEPVEAEQEAEADQSEPEAQDESEQPETVTIKIDGKEVEVTLDELKKGYQRQADYTRKTMEVSETRKQAEAEANKAREERNNYVKKLNEQQVILSNVLQEQQNIDWQTLLDTDPVEYLKQQHLFQERQVAYQRNQAEQQQIWQLQKQEQAQSVQKFLIQQQDELLAKLPEWKDETKAKAEKAALKEYLKDSGYSKDEIESLSDHRSVITARKAMLYDQMISKAQAAAKKVENLPKRVERSGNGQSPALDKRTTAYQKFQRSGTVEDAAAVFANFI